MSYLFFDVETTDLPNDSLPLDHPKQAHICQIAALLTNDKFEELASLCLLIKPRGWNIQAKAEERHGIPQSKCEKFGVEIDAAIKLFDRLFDLSQCQIAYSAEFDKKLITIERAVSKSPIMKDWNLKCPMKPLTPICKLPNKWNNGYKWPTLSQAFEFCFKKSMLNNHDAMGDVLALREIYKWCVNNHIQI